MYQLIVFWNQFDTRNPCEFLLQIRSRRFLAASSEISTSGAESTCWFPSPPWDGVFPKFKFWSSAVKVAISFWRLWLCNFKLLFSLSKKDSLTASASGALPVPELPSAMEASRPLPKTGACWGNGNYRQYSLHCMSSMLKTWVQYWLCFFWYAWQPASNKSLRIPSSVPPRPPPKSAGWVSMRAKSPAASGVFFQDSSLLDQFPRGSRRSFSQFGALRQQALEKTQLVQSTMHRTNQVKPVKLTYCFKTNFTHRVNPKEHQIISNNSVVPKCIGEPNKSQEPAIDSSCHPTLLEVLLWLVVVPTSWPQLPRFPSCLLGSQQRTLWRWDSCQHFWLSQRGKTD